MNFFKIGYNSNLTFIVFYVSKCISRFFGVGEIKFVRTNIFDMLLFERENKTPYSCKHPILCKLRQKGFHNSNFFVKINSNT